MGIATWRSPVFQRALGIIFDWRDDVDFEFGILPVRPDHIDPRIGLQQSSFTFHGSACPILTPEANKTLSYMIVPSGHKETIKKQLLLLGVNDFSIFGDLDSLARRLKASYQCG